MIRILRFVVAVLGLLALGACEEESDILVEQAPLLLRNLVPSDGVTVDPTESQNISMVFNRPARIEEINLRLVPEPIATGPVRSSSTGRTLVWTDVELDPAVLVHRLLVYGGSLLRPSFALYFTQRDEDRPKGRFLGRVRADGGGLTGPQGVVIFALDAETLFNPLEPETFLDAVPIAISAISHNGDGRQAQFAIDFLPEGAEFLVVAVLDTSDDGIHDPALDWWGYHHALAEIEPIVVTARSADFSSDVDISLGPPR